MRPRQVGIMRGGSIGRIGTPIPFGAAMLANSRLRPDSCTATKSATWVCGTCRSRKVINYHNGGLRREVTVELVTQLNEMLKCKDGVDRTKLHRLVKNLITQATTAGDLTAILAIYDRLEGRPSQKIVGPDNGPLQIEYKTIEEVHMFLLERGIDSLRVPPPPMKLVARTDAHACKKPALVDHAHRVAADQEPCRVLCVQRSLR